MTTQTFTVLKQGRPCSWHTNTHWYEEVNYLSVKWIHLTSMLQRWKEIIDGNHANSGIKNNVIIGVFWLKNTAEVSRHTSSIIINDCYVKSVCYRLYCLRADQSDDTEYSHFRALVVVFFTRMTPNPFWPKSVGGLPNKPRGQRGQGSKVRGWSVRLFEVCYYDIYTCLTLWSGLDQVKTWWVTSSPRRV